MIKQERKGFIIYLGWRCTVPPTFVSHFEIYSRFDTGSSVARRNFFAETLFVV